MAAPSYFYKHWTPYSADPNIMREVIVQMLLDALATRLDETYLH